MPDPNDPLEQFYAAHPEMRPGAATGSAVGKLFTGGSTATAPKPAAPPATPPPAPANTQKPAGTEVSPGRIVSSNGLTEYTLNPQTNAWTPSPYPPSAADRAAAGIKAPASTSTYTPRPTSATPYTPQPYGPISLQQIEATTREVSPGVRMNAQGQTYSQGNDGTYRVGTNYGSTASGRAMVPGLWTSANPTPQSPLAGAIANSAQPNSAQLPTTAGAVAASTPRGGNGLAGVAGTLGQGNGPTLPGFDNFVTPGQGYASEGRQQIYDRTNGINQMQAGRQGSATQFPVAPGIRLPGQEGRNIQFAAGNTNHGTLQPQWLMPQTSVSVPDTYVQGQGNVGDANRAFDVPFNIGPNGAASMQIAGNNVQVQSADKGTGYGFTLNNPAASSVFALTGRNGSEDPALQAAQIMQLNTAIAQGHMGDLMATNPNQFGGNPAGTGNGPWSGNGGSYGQNTFEYGGGKAAPAAPAVAPVAPQAPAGPPGYNAWAGGVSNPTGLADAPTLAAIQALADQRDKEGGGGDGGYSSAEGGTIGNYAKGGSVVSLGRFGQQSGRPLGDAKGFARGGQVTANPQQDAWADIYEMKGLAPPRLPGALSQGSGHTWVPGFANGADVIAGVTPGQTAPEITQKTVNTSAPATAIPNTTPLNGSGDITGGGQTNMSASAAGDAQASSAAANVYQPQNDEQKAALQPFTDAAQYAGGQQHARDTQDYIRSRAGLGRATEVPYLGQEGQATAPGQYVGYGTWLNNMINSIGGKYQQIQELGGDVDPTQVQNQLNTINQQKAPYEQANNLYTQIAGLGNVRDAATIQQELNAAKQAGAPLEQIQALQSKRAELGDMIDPEAIAGQIYNLNNSRTQNKAIGVDDPAMQGYYEDQAKQIAEAQAHNTAIQQTEAAIQNIMQQTGMQPGDLAQRLAQYQAQQSQLAQESKNAQTLAQLQGQLGNLVPGQDQSAVSSKLAGYQTQMTPLQQQLANAGQVAQTKGTLSNLLKTSIPKFAKGGSMITPEEIIGIGAKTGKPYFRVGEPVTPGGKPRAEKLQITPLHRDSTPADAKKPSMGKFARKAA